MVWSCVDFADEVQRPEMFCIRFASAERAQEFKKAYEDACEKMKDILGEGGAAPAEGPSEADQEADALADRVQEAATVKDDAVEKEE
jgi:Ran-binding protein 1